MRTWKCKGCGREVRLTQEDIAEAGIPICGQCDTEFEGADMELLPAEPLNLQAVCDYVNKFLFDSKSVCDGGPLVPSELAEAFEMAKVSMPSGKPKLRLIVSMHGGTVETVYADNSDVEITDVVFTEDFKYLDDEPVDGEGDYLFEIHGGQLDGNGIYTHHGGVQWASAQTWAAVMAAAEARARHGEGPDEDPGK